ncbi:MAG: glycosyl transferase family 1 [Chloroflexi bacterium RBG_16_57_11]|nr:MAG: glycosyl transferase family 1 [Chloroflexi bacterium RBG_16_57_11]
MKILLLYDYPPPPGGLPTQGDLLLRGLREIGVEAYAANYESTLEKEWYYRWLHPDIVVGIGYWGHTPHIIHHPQEFNLQPVPWLVADGFIADHQQTLNSLPLMLVTSNWVKEVYIRDGLRGENIEVLPVGCDTDKFSPLSLQDPKVAAIRLMFGVHPDQILILTVGGDGASKGAQEVMTALACLEEGSIASSAKGQQGYRSHPDWKYVCKVWPQDRTILQNRLDLELADSLGIADRVSYRTDRISRDIMPYLFAACDIYAAPSRLEGFGMPQIEAGACEKPVLGIAAMAMLDTLVDGETALLAGVAVENRISEAIIPIEIGSQQTRRVKFDPPRIADYRADVGQVRNFLEALIDDPDLRRNLGNAARKHVVEHFDYRAVARRFVEIVSRRLGVH